MIVNFTNTGGLSGIDFEVERIKSTIKLVKGHMPQRKPKLSESFNSIFGWSMPRELECWLGVRHWPVEEFQYSLNKSKVIIDLPLLLSNSFIRSLLKSQDENDRLILHYNDRETAIAIFSGLLFAGTSASGEDIYLDCSIDADATYSSVYSLDASHSRDHRFLGASFSSFILDSACSFLENMETPNTPGEKSAIQDLRKLQQEIIANFEVTSKREATVMRRVSRAHWLVSLMANKALVPGEIITASPKYSTWLYDRETLVYDPFNLHYWMFAHYFLGNEKECLECIETANLSKSLLSLELAKTVTRLIENPNDSGLGEIAPEMLAKFTEDMKVYMVPAHKAKDQREAMLAEKGGVADLSPYVLIKAVKDADTTKIKELVDAGQDINESYEYETALSTASQNEDLELVSFLLDLDAEVTVSSLHWAVIKGNLELLKTLVTNARHLKKLFNERYYFGQTLLHCSIRRDNRTVYDYLIKHGADPNITTDFKETPLMEAAVKGHFEYIDSLVKNGAKMNAKDENKRTALHYAAENSVKCIQKLIKNNANLNVRDAAERTPLMLAAQIGNYQGVKELLKNGAKKNLEDIDGATAADLARNAGHVQLADYIDEHVFTPML